MPTNLRQSAEEPLFLTAQLRARRQRSLFAKILERGTVGLVLAGFVAGLIFCLSMTERQAHRRFPGSLRQVVAHWPTPQDLAAAIQANDLKQVNLLLEEGINANCRVHVPEDFITPDVEQILSGEVKRPDGKVPHYGPWTPLTLALETHANTHLVQTLHSHKDATMRQVILMGQQTKQAHLIQILLNHGADPNIPTYGGTMPLETAAQEGSLTIMQLLLKKGAHVDAQDRGGDTALICACAAGHPKTVAAILAAHANVNIKDNDGRTALDMAKYIRNKQIIHLLEQAGAK